MRKIKLADGNGGAETDRLVSEVFAKWFSNALLDRFEDAAVIGDFDREKDIAISTDSFVVTPLEFPGGDIGKLAAIGTTNDLLMMGAQPKYLTAGFVLGAGLDIGLLERVAGSLAEAAEAAGAIIVAGDTKTIEAEGALIINTGGVGFANKGSEISAANASDGDKIILSGDIGDHHAAIMSARLGIENKIISDLASLESLVMPLIKSGLEIKAMRDVTRGGLATVLNEIAVASGVAIELTEEKIPVKKEVVSIAKMLGLDPLYMGNEGKFVAVVCKEDADEALKILKRSALGKRAEIIGEANQSQAGVYLRTRVGGTRRLEKLEGEGLPRIC
jgi:hydrogenase expression/formation protein HypE